MERHERTVWGFIFALMVVGILGVSLVIPWWTYTYSTGQRTAPGGPQDPADTRVEREHLDVFPHRTEGRSNNTTAADVQQHVRTLGTLVTAAMAVAGLIVLLEMPVPFPFSTRWVTLVLMPLGFVAAACSLAYAWFWIPEMVARGGVDDAFTAKELPGGFVQTWINWGWVAGLVATLVYPGIFAFKYQAGATDPTVIETYRHEVR